MARNLENENKWQQRSTLTGYRFLLNFGAVEMQQQDFMEFHFFKSIIKKKNWSDGCSVLKHKFLAGVQTMLI